MPLDFHRNCLRILGRMKRKILVLELWGLGDLTFSTVFLQSALQAGDEVHLLGKNHARALLEPSFPQVRFFSLEAGWTKFRHKYRLWRWNWRALLGLLKELRKERYDIVVSARNDPRDHLLMALIGARRKIGFPHRGARLLLTDRVKRSRGPAQHKVEDWRDLGEAAGFSGIRRVEPMLRHEAYRTSRLDLLFGEWKLPVVLLHAGARIPVRRWPAAYFETLIGLMRREFKFHLVLVPDPDGGGSSLSPLADVVLNDLALPELTDLMGRADLVLCNDSGPGHLAAAMRRPCLVFFGPTAPNWFRPWGEIHHLVIRDFCRHRPCFDYCRYSEPFCMTRLRPEIVWGEVRRQIHQLVFRGLVPQAILSAPPAPEAPGQPMVVVLTATYRRAAHLERMLASLEPGAVRLAVLVIDNADDPATAAVVEKARERMEIDRIVPGENLSCGGGLALGEKAALERYGDRMTHLWMMDDDIQVAPGTLSRLVAAMTEEGAALACPLITYPDGRIGWFPGLLEKGPFDALRKGRVVTPEAYLEKFGPKPVPFSWATGVSLLVTRETLEETGLHRTDFWLRGEDFEFSLRISARHKAIFVPDTRITHYCFSGPYTPEAIAMERKKQVAMLRNVAYIGGRLPHGRRIFRTLPGNLWRHCKNWGVGGLPEGLRAYWQGGVAGHPAGGGPVTFKGKEPSPFQTAKRSGLSAPSVHSRGQNARVLQIFSRYTQYGGEEGSVYRIGDALMETHQVEYYLKSTANLLERKSFGKAAALVDVFHNFQAARDVRRMQEIGRFDLWQIHNVFPAVSPAIYHEAFRLKIPTLHYLHNYRMGCINGFFLDHGSPCQKCIHGNFRHAAAARCWHESALICGWMGLVMKRLQQMDVFHRINRWVAISEAQRQVHIEMGIPGDRIDVIHHFYESKGPALPLPKDGYALFLGRLSNEKGCMDLVKAWRLMPPHRKLVIAGTGPELPALEAYAASARLTNVHFAGFVSKECQDALWQGASFLVVPSVWLEPFGMVVLEAWSRGRPVVAYAIGALPELVADGRTGLLVRPFDVNGLAAAMERLFGNPDELAALAQAGRRELETRFSKAVWASKIHATYEKTLSTPL